MSENKKYEQVMIRSAEDLPKERNEYLALSKYSGLGYFLWDAHNNSFWLSSVDWYLKPLEQKSEGEKEAYLRTLLMDVIYCYIEWKNGPKYKSEDFGKFLDNYIKRITPSPLPVKDNPVIEKIKEKGLLSNESVAFLKETDEHFLIRSGLGALKVLKKMIETAKLGMGIATADQMIKEFEDYLALPVKDEEFGPVDLTNEEPDKLPVKDEKSCHNCYNIKVAKSEKPCSDCGAYFPNWQPKDEKIIIANEPLPFCRLTTYCGYQQTDGRCMKPTDCNHKSK